jgi:hypothetical protein
MPDLILVGVVKAESSDLCRNQPRNPAMLSEPGMWLLGRRVIDRSSE